MAANFSPTRSADGQAVAWQTLLGVLSAVLLIGVILVVVRGVLLRPLEVLSAHTAALADGDQSPEELRSEDWCDEMQALSSHCARLAQRVESSKGDAL